SRPPHGPREQRRAHDRALRCAVRPAGGRPDARLALGADHGGGLRRRPRRARRLRIALAVDPQRAEPRRSRAAPYTDSFSRSSRLTTFGSALPSVSRITWPTRNP